MSGFEPFQESAAASTGSAGPRPGAGTPAAGGSVTERPQQQRVFCGIDWAERHHDVALVDAEGVLLAKQRISDDAQGFARLLALLAEHGAAPGPDGTPVAIETAAGLLPAAVVAAGYRLFPINPLAVSRYRDRYGAAKAKSDAGDAFVLANIARTDLPAHRPLPADSELVQTIRVLARAHADAVGDRQQAQNKLRSLLREYYPAALAALPDLSTVTARAALRLAPTPAAAAALAPEDLRAALVQAGRHTRLATEVPRVAAGLRAEQLRQPAMVELAMGEQALALLGLLDAASAAVVRLEKALTAAFAEHDDAPILLSQPGLGTVLAARLLAELGDDRSRFSSARGLRAFAGTAPITRASGSMRGVFARRVRNRRLAQVAYQWAFSLLTASPGARAHYDQRRARRDGHSAAGRRLASRHLSIAWHCLQTRTLYDEAAAYPAPARSAA